MTNPNDKSGLQYFWCFATILRQFIYVNVKLDARSAFRTPAGAIPVKMIKEEKGSQFSLQSLSASLGSAVDRTSLYLFRSVQSRPDQSVGGGVFTISPGGPGRAVTLHSPPTWRNVAALLISSSRLGSGACPAAAAAAPGPV